MNRGYESSKRKVSDLTPPPSGLAPGVVSGLVFDCACGDVFREDKYPEPYRYDTYRGVVNAHRERCSLAAGLSDALEPRPVRPAADETPTPPSVYSSAANQTPSILRRLFSGVPASIRARVAVWPFDPSDFTH